MKKYTLIFLVSFMLFVLDTNSQNATLKIDDVEISSVEVGGDVIIPVRLEAIDNGGSSFIAILDFFIEYNHTLLTWKGDGDPPPGVQNFHPEMPWPYNWLFGDNGTRLNCQWVFTTWPGGEISNGEVFFELIFTYNGGLQFGESSQLVWQTETIMANEFIIDYNLQLNNGSIYNNKYSLNVKVFLEGPFNGIEMNTDLNEAGLIPLSQPYNIDPWYYTGTENMISIPGTDVVDWVLVELRDATKPETASHITSGTRKAALLLADGTIVDVNGISLPVFSVSITNYLYAVVWHRTHLGIMSANPLIKVDEVYSYDFSTNAEQAYLNGQKDLGGGYFGLYCGDGDANSIVEVADKNNIWKSQTGNYGYKQADFNLDGEVNNQDKNDYWLDNLDINSTLVVHEVFNPLTGRTWMDRNLGASRVALSSNDDLAYGDLYQWGRLTDGHESRTSNTTFTLSSTDVPGHGDLILLDGVPNDWRSPQNDNLWQGVHGVNNPCPSGFRLPTEEEWEAERQSWVSDDAAGAYGSPLKHTVAGMRQGNDASLFRVGERGYYMSSKVVGTNIKRFSFKSDGTYWANSLRKNAFSVRCIKNQRPNSPSNPIPEDGSTDIGINNDLFWTCSDPEGDPLTYDVYFGTNPDPLLIFTNLSVTTYDPGTLDLNTTYYWKIAAFDSSGDSTISTVWNFTSVPPTIGDYAYGGIVFYLDGSGGGMVCAISDQGSTEWGCQYTEINGADGIAIGTGAQNTIDIVAGCGTPGIAAHICANLSLNGYSDWFSPSKDELNLIFQNKSIIDSSAVANGGSALSYVYWSSTEINSGTAWMQEFNNGIQGEWAKDSWESVRAVRAF